jgi:amidase
VDTLSQATELAYAGAARQARLVRDGEASAREVTEATLRRIEALDPTLNAYRVVFAEQALAAADEADARRSAGEDGLLLGVPVCIKDDVDVAGETTAWGTAAHGGPVARDAEVVSRLRAAGAIVLGKTLVPEMTMLPATDTTTFGSARNPWDLSRTPGGSSGGTAAAVASGMAGVGLGSDGAGSIRNPSAWCGLFGIKPTRDRVPMAPHADAWQGLSVNGPLARTVADAALFLDATADRAPQDGFLAAAGRDARPLRIAVSTKAPLGAWPRIGEEERRAVQETADLLRSLGHDVVERDPDWPPAAWPATFVRVLRGVHDDVSAAMPYPERLEQRTRRIAAVGGHLPERLVRWARTAEPEMSARIGALWRDADVLLCPAATDGPYPAGVVGRWGAATYLARAAERLSFYPAFNMTGQPACSVPAGTDRDGLPVGVQLVGRHDDDPTLISLAGQLERARPWARRRPPVG